MDQKPVLTLICTSYKLVCTCRLLRTIQGTQLRFVTSVWTSR